MKVGVIGLGRMGGPMARNIRAGGHSVAVCDIRPEVSRALASDGIRVCDSPREVASECPVILTSLPGPKEVATVLTGPGGVLDAVAEGSIVVETSTIGPSQSRDLAAAFRERRCFFLDAPVSGAREGALAGTLTIMVGGDAGAFSRVRPVFECVGSNIRHLGPSGAGSGMKLVVQMIFMSYVATFFEGLELAERLGIDLATALDVLGSSSAVKPDLTKRFGMLGDDDLTPRFEVASAIKDLALAREACADVGHVAEIATAALAAFRATQDLGLGDRDLIAVRRMHRGSGAKWRP